MLRLYFFTTLSACFAALVGLVYWALLTLLYYATGWQELAGSTSVQVAAMVLITFTAHLFFMRRLYRSLRGQCMSALQAFTYKRPLLGLLAFMGLSLWAVRAARAAKK
jgi:hypothetical protein